MIHLLIFTVEKFEYNVKNNSKNNFHIEPTSLNGKEYLDNFIKYVDIQNGGTFDFNMTNSSNLYWGSQPENVPYSLNLKNK